jgi:hypothetical protein
MLRSPFLPRRLVAIAVLATLAGCQYTRHESTLPYGYLQQPPQFMPPSPPSPFPQEQARGVFPTIPGDNAPAIDHGIILPAQPIELNTRLSSRVLQVVTRTVVRKLQQRITRPTKARTTAVDRGVTPIPVGRPPVDNAALQAIPAVAGSPTSPKGLDGR